MDGPKTVSSIVVVTGTVVVCVALLVSARSLVLGFDRTPIASATLEDLEELFPEAEQFQGVLPDHASEAEIQAAEREEGPQYPVYLALAGGELIGTAVRGAGEGYQSTIRVLVALDRSGTITAVRVTDQDETAGLGDVILEDEFLERFVGKDRDDSIDIDTDADFISGATVSAEGAAEAVRAALVRYEEVAR